MTSTGTTTAFNPFAGIEDEAELSAQEMLDAQLVAARRGWFPLRKTFVQRPRGSEPQEGRPSARASVLSDVVRGRHQLPLDLYLTLHALQPVLGGSPLKLATWARLMSVDRTWTSTTVSRAVDTLVDLKLVRREGTGHSPALRLLLEDGSGEPWTKPGSSAETGPGYFIVPDAYFTSGLHARLRLPGKAMFLITLAETQQPTKPAFKMAYERAMEWYGVSERTAERGFQELSTENLLLTRVQKVQDRNHPAGRREDTWRALDSPYSTPDRASIQAAAVSAARAALGAGSPGRTTAPSSGAAASGPAAQEAAAADSPDTTTP